MKHHPMRFIFENVGDISKGIGSAGLSTLAVITSFQQDMEFGLRCASLVGAIIVSVLTTISLIKNLRKK